MLRLVAYRHDGVHRYPVPLSEAVLGSQPDCDVWLPYTGVAKRHARLAWDGEELRIHDLGSRRGLLVNGERVHDASLRVLDEIRLGSVTLLVEEAGLPAVASVVEPAAPPSEPRITPELMTAHVAALSDWVLGDTESRATAESILTLMLADFGGGVLFLLQLEGENQGIKLVVASDPAWLACGEPLLDQARQNRQRPTARQEVGYFTGYLLEEEAWVFFRFFSGLERAHLLLAAFPRFRPKAWVPIAALRAVADLLVLGLVHHVGRYEPILPGREAQPDLRLAPGLVTGESPAMKRMLDQLRGAIDPAVQVLLRGETGTGKELLARSLHLSGRRAGGPFVVASCAGASESALAADLFGSPAHGKDEHRRPGKFEQAVGGTLLLTGVESLPLAIQARLVRFLRSGEIEPAGTSGPLAVDVRLIAAASGPLEPLVARDLFRVDLLHRLSRCVVDVPPLRERREDLPLLIQGFVNRFCHEAGKRVQGISVKAMAALSSYGYPGNVAELENLIRQLVYVCPPGQPIRHNLLPERMRDPTLQVPTRVDATADLDLERLVAACEAAAIREALRRADGNKALAAKLLGISRNGLAMKMVRRSIPG
ncbi:MAG: sigma 54-interacting transcriptional regulator [Acidobacteriota bacterium]